MTTDQRPRWSKQSFPHTPFSLYVRSGIHKTLTSDSTRAQNGEDDLKIPDIMFDSYCPPVTRMSKEVQRLQEQADWFADRRISKKRKLLS